MTGLVPAATAAAHAVLAGLLEARTGQQLSSYRAWRLDTALKPLLRARGFDTLEQLVALLLTGDEASLGDRIVDALLNGESSFFRDQQVFQLIDDAFSTTMTGAHRPRIWSAGCATGQEPLSLAMMFAEHAEASGAPIPEIVATDVSDAALARARTGRFTQFEIQRGLPIRRMMRWFEPVDGDWIAQPSLAALIRYQRLNLVADAPPAGRFDLILCRNVLLYLSGGARDAVFAGLARALRPDGLLVLGAGETVIGQTDLFRPSRRHRGLYERVDAEQGRQAA